MPQVIPLAKTAVLAETHHGDWIAVVVASTTAAIDRARAAIEAEGWECRGEAPVIPVSQLGSWQQ